MLHMIFVSEFLGISVVGIVGGIVGGVSGAFGGIAGAVGCVIYYRYRKNKKNSGILAM